MNLVRKLWRRGRDIFPIAGFHFDRPLVLLQSDDWGRVGLRDQGGMEELRSAGIVLGERPYDFYTLETAEDVAALTAVLRQHRDSNRRHPCMEMNFVPANLDFAKMKAEDFRQIYLLSLAGGLPGNWNRPGLLESYREGISAGVLHPGLHGSTHFCRAAVERNLAGREDRAQLLHTIWNAETPYIHWRMPWIGYEYWDPEKSEDERFLPLETQQDLVGHTVGAFARLFSTLPRSACAPGYRANDDTHRAWAEHGIRIAQNGPGAFMPPHLDRDGMLQLYRTVELEPAVDAGFSVEASLRQAESCFSRGIPAIVSVHSINFHSTVQDFRSATLRYLHEFLGALESRHTDLLYLDDENLFELVHTGSYAAPDGAVTVNVTRKNFSRAHVARGGYA
jgi:hypothetical protein